MDATKNYLLQHNIGVETEILIALEHRIMKLERLIKSWANVQKSYNTTRNLMESYADALTAYNTLIGKDIGLFDGRISGERRR